MSTSTVDAVGYELLRNEFLSYVLSRTDLSNKESIKTCERVLQNVGMKLGAKLIERIALNEQRAPVGKLETMKFICREFWVLVFEHKISRLRTNNKDVFVMADDAFSWIRSLSSDTEEKSQAIVNLYLNLPCGLLRGALSGLGYDARVTVELKRFPECIFTVQFL